MGLKLLGIMYNECSENCVGLLMVFKCSVALVICYIANTDLEILVHRLLLIIQETNFTAPQVHVMMKLGRKLWRSLG